MWYVMQVRTGREEKTVFMVEQHTAGNCKKICFLPKFERKRKYGGDWQVEQAVLFPGYVFVDTEEIEKLYLLLKKVPDLTKVLGTGELWTPVNEEDLMVLQHLLNQEYVMEMSEGIMVDERIVIAHGPLKGMEALIRKVDRHRRTARVEIQMFGRRQEVEVGVEILRKE